MKEITGRDIFSLNINYAHRVFGLDLVRAVAILLVVVEHSSPLIISLPIPVTTLFSGFGFWGVELFFVLSGFLVGSILIKLLDHTKPRWNTLVGFWKRRWYRTLPNYYLLLAANIILIWASTGQFDAVYFQYTLFIQNIFGPHPAFFGEAWTLAVEEWFYLIVPISTSLLCLVVRKPQKALLYAIVSIILAVNFLRFAQSIRHPGMGLEIWDIFFRKVVVLRLDALMFGVLGAYVLRYHSDVFKCRRNTFFAIGIALIGFDYAFSRYFIERGAAGLFAKTLYFSSCSLGILLLLPRLYYFPQPCPLLYKTITSISVLSYSMYLIHNSLLLNTSMTYFPAQTLPGALAIYVAYWSVLISAAIIIYKCFEKPIMDLRDR